MTVSDRQLPLDLDHRTALGRADFMISDANREAVLALENWEQWANRRLALIGPAGAGKTHLAHVWMSETDARLISARELTVEIACVVAEHGRVVVDDCDQLSALSRDQRAEAEDALFHLYNLAHAEGSWLMLTGRSAPANWPVLRPDLGSRLSTFPVAWIKAPDDALLSALLIKLFADRQLRVSPDVISYLVRRIDRSFETVGRTVDSLDRAALSQKARVTRQFASAVMGWSEGEEDK